MTKGNMRKKLGEIGLVVFELSERRYKQINRLITCHTHHNTWRPVTATSLFAGACTQTQTTTACVECSSLRCSSVQLKENVRCKRKALGGLEGLTNTQLGTNSKSTDK